MEGVVTGVVGGEVERLVRPGRLAVCGGRLIRSCRNGRSRSQELPVMHLGEMGRLQALGTTAERAGGDA